MAGAETSEGESATSQEKLFLDFLDFPSRSAKPRSAGKTMCLTGGNVPEWIITEYAEYIDVIKLVSGTFWMSEDHVQKLVNRCHDQGIEVQIGGIAYEISRLQNKGDHFLDLLERLGVDWVEYETHVAQKAPDEMQKQVAALKERDFNVIGEVGAKWYWRDDTRFTRERIDVERTIAEMESYLEAGCDYVYWEGLIVQNLLGRELQNREGQKALLDVANSVGPDNIYFECWGPTFATLEYGKFWAWLVKQIGPEVNLGNVPIPRMTMIESIRRGVYYEMDHPYIRWLDQDKPTDHWWQMDSPPYDVGLDAKW